MPKEVFLSDENFDFRIVKSLREKEYKVHAIVEMEPGITDKEVIKFSNELDAIILTEDNDFGELTYRLNLKSQGIILVRHTFL